MKRSCVSEEQIIWILTEHEAVCSATIWERGALPRTLDQAIPASLALEIVDDLIRCGLADIHESGAYQVRGGNLIHCLLPFCRWL
ncbi:hypothetical protein AYJ54_18740 [Bradyrhizobium centrolobii]|uniref:Uncharacterized protein n=2 Tax=Bradyrhizobium TaxID=374 RepID=A0A176ZEZ7_9BRAD|nr:hypothetical protein AYJ54_18740 [Bradyrhizobium centrolobii]OAF19250.1 hypothetical protein AXW67_38020 [Bradyrhizobium neotropicale]